MCIIAYVVSFQLLFQESYHHTFKNLHRGFAASCGLCHLLLQAISGMFFESHDRSIYKKLKYYGGIPNLISILNLVF
jgi:hypothetical protein